MTTFCLVRHAAAAGTNQILHGRARGVHLTPEGLRETRRLAEMLAAAPVSAIYSSPLERAMETAAAISARLKLPVDKYEPLIEVDYGEWTGVGFADLAADERWRSFNSSRSTAPIPGGESALAVQARAVAGLEHLCGCHPDEMIVLVSHAEVIRMIICHFAGIPLDLSLRVEVRPASISIVTVCGGKGRILAINYPGDLGNVLPTVAGRRNPEAFIARHGASPEIHARKG